MIRPQEAPAQVPPREPVSRRRPAKYPRLQVIMRAAGQPREYEPQPHQFIAASAASISIMNDGS